MELPIVCTLTESELQERRRAFLDPIRANTAQVVPIPDGYAYGFKPSPEVLALLSKLVELESRCCAFLTFKIIVAPQRPITLEVSGPPEAKTIIADYFGIAVSESILTCPHCQHAQLATMPTDQCLILFKCDKCHAEIRPLPGDCCVFCSYASMKCPPVQIAN